MAHEELEQQNPKSHGERISNQRPNLERYQEWGNGLHCNALIPGPTRLEDTNRVRGARLGTGTLYLKFFFFKQNLYLWVWPTSYNRIKISYTFTESHLHIQNYTFTLQIRARNLHVVNPYKCVGPTVCGCLLMSSPVPTRIKNPC